MLTEDTRLLVRNKAFCCSHKQHEHDAGLHWLPLTPKFHKAVVERPR